MKKFLPNSIKSISRFLREKSNLELIKSFNISNSGIDEEGDPFISLDNGYTFYGYLPDAVQCAMYDMFVPKSVKSKVPKDAINVALDIAKRYWPHDSKHEAYEKNRFPDLPDGAVVIEGGAFIGFYAMLLCDQVGPSGKVIAIEAIPENFRLLKKNQQKNKLDQLQVLERAIYSQNQTLTFYRTQNQLASFSKDVIHASDTYDVRASSIDSIIAELNQAVSHIRLQLNGAEFEAINGMDQVLNNNPELIVTARYKSDGKDIFNLVDQRLKQSGYSTHHFGDSIYTFE